MQPIFEAISKAGIVFPILNVLRNCSPNNLGYGAFLDGRYSFQGFRLVGTQPDRHSFSWFHVYDLYSNAPWLSSCKIS